MNAFEKIKERLEEKKKRARDLHGKPHMDYGTLVGWESAMGEALSIVSEVEAEFATDMNVGSNGWIPCGERLPEDSGRYMTTNMYEGEKKEVFDLWYEDGKWFIDAGEDETIRIVLAWMSLPSAYTPTTD